jgi:PAS domain S-box-containing protein
MPATQHQSAPPLLQSVLSASQNGILVYHAVRDDAGTIVDLRVAMLNAVAERDLGKPATDILGQLYSRLFSNIAKADLFDRYRRVMETGEATRFEFHYQPAAKTVADWFDISVVPLPDSIIVSYDNITQAKAAAAAVRQADLLQHAFDSAISGFTVYDALYDAAGQIDDFRFVAINEAGLRMSGYTREQLIGKTIWEIYPATGINGLFDQYVRVCQTGEPLSGEKYYPEYDLWRAYTIVRVADGVMISYTDITTQKKQEAIIDRQTELLRLVANKTPAGLVLWEAVRDDTPQRNVVDFRYRMSNGINNYLTGRTEEQLLGNDLLVLFPRFRGTELEMSLRDTLETGRTQHMLFTYYTEQQDRWIDAQFSRIGDNVHMTFMDVTEQHKIQLAQKQQAELFKTVVNADPGGLVLYDPVREQTTDGQPGTIVDFTYTLVNETNVRVTGRAASELIGNRLKALFPGEDTNQLFERAVVVAETGQPQQWQMPYFSNGIKGWFQSSLIRIHGQVLFTFLDVTDIKNKEEALEVANLNLRRSNENLQQFAYIASHDLQEPLRKIQSFGDMLATTCKDALDESGQDIIRRMQTSAQRMSILIEDLLTYSRLSTHRVPYNPIALIDVVRRVLADLELRIAETAAVIELGELPVVNGEQRQLEQLLLNLIGNALKFCRLGVAPHIRISCQQLPATAIPVGVLPAQSRSPQYVELNVSDNGIGFDEKYLDRIFQVFQRLHGKSNFPGSGVGLAICRKVIENHDGGITARSTPGLGSVFSVYLPVLNGQNSLIT